MLREKGPIPAVFPIGYDGIAFIVNNTNADSCITVTDVKKILSGQIAKWNQLNPKNVTLVILRVQLIPLSNLSAENLLNICDRYT